MNFAYTKVVAMVDKLWKHPIPFPVPKMVYLDARVVIILITFILLFFSSLYVVFAIGAIR